MRRRQLEHVAVDRLRRWHVLVREVIPERTAIHSSRAERQQRLDFGRERELSRTLQVEERLDTEAIPRHEQLTLLGVPDRECKHADELVEALRSVSGVQMQQHFRVGIGAERTW